LLEVMSKLEQTSLDQFLAAKPREGGAKKPSITASTRSTRLAMTSITIHKSRVYDKWWEED